MRIYLKTLTNRILPIEGIDEEHDVAKLKLLAYVYYGFLPEDTRFIFKGKCVYEGRTLADFEVTPESTIHTVFRMTAHFDE